MQTVSEFGNSRVQSGSGLDAVPQGLALLRPVYWIAGGVVAGGALYFGGIAPMTIAVAVLVALWAFAEPRAALWLTTAFMIFLFVFFQQTAPLGADLPAEFLFWGIGLAVITAGLMIAAIFSRQVNWVLVKKRFATQVSVAMFAMLIVIIAATVYGMLAGNQFSIVSRQLFGCVMLPVYYFLAVTLFRSAEDAAQWLRRASWVVTLGSLWYAQKLSLASATHGYYYREQSPLVAYSGAIALVALCELAGQRRVGQRLVAAGQFAVCMVAIVLMGSRTALGSLLAAVVALILILVWKRRVLVLGLVVCLLPLGVGLGPYLMNRMLNNTGLPGQIAGRFIFALDEDRSYQGRVGQTEVVWNMVNERPVLGAGMGSENSVFIPGEGRLKVASVDNGWGYLLLKMGYLGLAVFLVLVVAVLKTGLSGLSSVCNAMLRTDRLSVLAVFLYALVSFLGGPTFFHFSTAPFFAALLGALVTLGEARECTKPVPKAED